MITEELNENNLDVLISALKTKIIILTKAGDYPEKDRDKSLMKKLLNLKYEMNKTGGYMAVISD